MPNLVEKERTVGKIGEWIVKGLVHVLRLDHTLLSHVARIEHEPTNDRFLQQIRADVVDRHPVAVGVRQSPFPLECTDVVARPCTRSRATREFGEKLQRARRILRVQQGNEGGIYEFDRIVPQHRRH